MHNIKAVGTALGTRPIVQVRHMLHAPLMVEPQSRSTHSTAADAGDVVVLKKYGNRRIYDTRSSRYVTLGEVEAMVQQGTDIVVKDAKSGDDITKEILMQLLIERDGATAALPTSVLRQAVRLANSPLKEGLVKAVQEGLDTFMQNQRALIDAQRALSSQLVGRMNPWIQPTTPAALWNPFAPPPPPRPTPSDQHASQGPAAQPQQVSQAPGSDVDMLRAELAQTQALVQRLLERELSRESPAPTPKKTSAKASSAKKASKKSASKR